MVSSRIPLQPLKTSYLREDKSIAVEPVRVLGVEVHEFIEQDVSCWGQTHGRTRMPGIGSERSVDLGGEEEISFLTRNSPPNMMATWSLKLGSNNGGRSMEGFPQEDLPPAAGWC